MIGEQSLQPIARAFAVARENDPLPGLAQLGDMGGDRLIDIGLRRPLRREIARGVDAAVDHPVAFRLMERSEEHTSELQSLMRNSYAVFCLKKKTNKHLSIQTLIRNTLHQKAIVTKRFEH